MRGWATALAVGLFAAATSPARGQIGIILKSGSGPEPTTTGSYWVSVPPDVRALAVAEIVMLSQNPLNAHLVMLAAGGQTRELPEGLQNPTVPLPFGAGGAGMLYGGNPPPGQLGGVPPSNGGNGGGGSQGGGGTSAGSPLLSLAVDPPTDTAPGSVAVSALDPTGFPIGSGMSIPIPAKGWWTLGVDPDPFGNNPPPAFEPEPNPGPPINQEPEPNPNQNPNPNPTGPTTPPNTPEPATAVLAVIGGSMIGLARRRKK